MGNYEMLKNRFGDHEFLEIKEVAALLRYKEKSVRDRLTDRSFPIMSIKLVNRRVFKLAHVANYLDRIEADAAMAHGPGAVR